jgi:hypothetical protein
MGVVFSSNWLQALRYGNSARGFVQDCQFKDNTFNATAASFPPYGGSVSVTGLSVVELVGDFLCENSATVPVAGSQGGCLYIEQSNVTYSGLSAAVSAAVFR